MRTVVVECLRSVVGEKSAISSDTSRLQCFRTNYSLIYNGIGDVALFFINW